MTMPASAKLAGPSAPSDAAPTVLLVGGGSGGHIFPNIAIAEALADLAPQLRVMLVVSNRAIDARILTGGDWAFSTVPAAPFPSLTRPWRLIRFQRAWRQSAALTRRWIDAHRVVAAVGAGGFVCGPVLAAVARRRLPTALVHLDAVPGRANRWLARRADAVFTVHPLPDQPEARVVGFPLRRAALAGDRTPADCRQALGLDPHRRTLLVTGASQGAESINRMMATLIVDQPDAIPRDWQVLHLAGEREVDALRQAYAAAGVRAQVEAFVDEMGLAWGAADLAISRAGAGGVAEARANAVPTLFMPYPWHRDQHQRRNAQPLVDAGMARLTRDHIDPTANAAAQGPLLAQLTRDDEARHAMCQAMRQAPADHGAQAIAAWIAQATSRAD